METYCHLNIENHAVITYCRRQNASLQGGDPLLLIHGAASNMTRWTEFVEQTKLAMVRDILRLDLRGHGQSMYRGKIGLEIWCDDIAALLHQEGYQQAILIGHCLGANVAVMFASRYPQFTLGLVLVEPMLNQALVGMFGRLGLMKFPLQVVISIIHILNHLGVYRRQLAPLDLYALDKLVRDELGKSGGSEALVRRYASPWHDLKSMPAANFLQDLLEVIRPLPVDELRVPFLALLSSGRTFVDPQITASLLSELPQGTIHCLEAKHWIPTEQPLVMRQMIETWVNDLEI